MEGLDRLCADRLADEVDILVRRKVIDSRSPAADALLDYREPPSTPRSCRMAKLEQFIRDECSWLNGHACVTGDCPHISANECASVLTKELIHVAKRSREVLGEEG